MWNEEDRKWLYSKMKSAGVDTGSYADFTASMNNSQDRGWYYQKAKSMGLDVGSDKDFASMMVQPQQKKQTQTQAQSSTPIRTNVATPVVQTPPTAAQTKPQYHGAGSLDYKDAQRQKQLTPFKPTSEGYGVEEGMYKPQPVFEDNRSLDSQHNIVSTPKPVPYYSDGRMRTGYHDVVSGKYYDINDPASEAIAKQNTRTYSSFGDVETANRSQVGNLTSDIDAQLKEARGEAVAARVKKQEDAAKGGFWSSIQKAMAETAGQASPTDMQAAALQRAKYGDEETEEEVQRANGIRQLEAAQRSMRDAQRIINEADNNAQSGTFGKWLKSSFAGGAARGFGQKLFDADTWDMGMSDTQDAANILATLRKADKGEKLTKAEQTLLDAKAVELATNAYFGSYVGRGYKAGQVTAESIPFMLEMCINPASGAGSGAQAMMTRYALKRFGKEATKEAAKKMTVKAVAKQLGKKEAAKVVGARVAGDLAGSATMAATTGIGHVTSDAAERMAGNIQYDTDEDTGEAYYAGHTEGDAPTTAFAKAFANTTIENYSEMVGEYFSPVTSVAGKYVSKGMNKIGMKRVNDFMENVAASDVAKLVGDFEKQAKWNGVFGEYAEEVAGNMMNALVVGDQTFDTAEGTGVFNLDQNIDTFLGVSLMGGFMSGVKTAGYRTPKYRARKAMTSADDAAASEFGNQDTWGAIRNAIAFGSDEDAKQAIATVLADDTKTDAQKQAVLEYAKCAEQYKGMLRSEDSRRGEQNGSPEVDAETSYDNGYSLDDNQDMNDAKNMLDFKRQQLTEALGDIEAQWFEDALNGNVTDIDGKPWTLHGIVSLLRSNKLGEKGTPAYTPEQKQAALDYINAKATYDGVIDRVRDDIDSRVDASNRMVDERVNGLTGMIHPATLKLEDKKVYIVDGIVNMHQDGSMVDVANSSESILARDAETGMLQWISPQDILSVDEHIDPAAEKEAAQAQLREQYAQEKADAIDGKLPFAIGDTYNVVDNEGKEWTAQIVADNGDGTVQVSYNGSQQPVTAKKEDLQEWAENANLARLQQYVMERKEKQLQADADEKESQRPVYSLNDELALQTPDGIVRGSVTTEENEDGRIEVFTETPINGQKINLFTRDELDNMLLQQNGQDVVIPRQSAEEVQTPGTNEAATVQNGGETVQNEGGSVAEAPETVQNEPMPMTGEGDEAEPDFTKATPKRAHDYIFGESGLSEEDARSFMQNNVESADKALEKIKGKKPKIGTSIAKYNRETAEWQKKVDDAQATADYWHNVKAERDKVLAQRNAERAEEQLRATEEAQRQEAAYQAEQERKKQVQEELGTNNVSQAIRDKWQNAPKVDGAQSEIVLPNGEKVAGHYVLAESGAASASHDSNNGFVKTEGFPVDENGGSVNDRDYEQDKDAQTITRNIAAQYDSRAVQDPVVVSQDGVVLSGNGRTMAGELAARNNTDGAYIDHIRKYPQQWGFTKEQVEGMQHPRIYFVPDASMPYTAETFAKFNQNEKKGQSKTEQAVKLGKVVDDKTFARIIQIINRFDTLGDFYADSSATAEAVSEMQDAGVITQNQVAEIWDGEGLSAIGKELLENMLIGKAFESNPNAVREASELKQMRQSIITALAEISNNLTLGKDYSLESELAQAIDLVYTARKSGGYKTGERVSGYARQQNLFPYEMGETVADFNNATVLMLADVINDNRSTLLKKYMQIYNHRAQDAANGQLDLFSAGVSSKQDIINDVKTLFNNGTEEQQTQAAKEAVEKRKESSNAEDAALSNGVPSSNAGNSQVEETTPAMTHQRMVEFTRQFLIETDGDMRLMEHITDEEMSKILGLLDAWEEVNEKLGDAHTQYDPLLTSKDKEVADNAKAEIRKAEQESEKAFMPVQDYYHDLLDEYGIEDDMELVNAPETTVNDAIAKAEQETEQNPTDAQKEAGNYKKGHVKVDGYDITIENPKGSTRSGKDADGKEWSVTMNNTYGYIRGTEGVDGDHIDVFLSDDPTTGNVYVIDQKKEDGTFDEHKVMYGFDSAEEARQAYLANYSEDWKGLGVITEVSKDEFKKWIESSHRKTKPFADYKSVKVEAAQNEGTQDTDNHGNMIDADGKLIVDAINSIDELTDEDFNEPTRSVQLPALPVAVNDAIGANGKPVVIKKNIFAKNKESHKDLTPADSRQILGNVLYNPNLYGQNQKVTRPYNWILIHLADKNEAVIVEVNDSKDNLEIVNWHYLSGDALKRKERQAAKEGGHILTLESAAANTQSDLSSEGKITNNSSNDQEKGEKLYKISPFEYTTKRGKKLNMQLVTFTGELTKEQTRAAATLAKADKGWWSKENGGYLMRDEESAQRLADAVLNDEDAVADAQPLSVKDMSAATDATVLQEAEDSVHTYQYDEGREEAARDNMLVELTEQMNAGTLTLDMIDAAVELLTSGGRRLEEEIPNSQGDEQKQLYHRLEETKGNLRAYYTIRRTLAEKRGEQIAFEEHGAKKGDKVIWTYNGKREPATIYDFETDGRPVLDTGLAPVMYVNADWEDVEMVEKGVAKTEGEEQKSAEIATADYAPGTSYSNDQGLSATIAVRNNGGETMLHVVVVKKDVEHPEAPARDARYTKNFTVPEFEKWLSDNHMKENGVQEGGYHVGDTVTMNGIPLTVEAVNADGTLQLKGEQSYIGMQFYDIDPKRLDLDSQKDSETFDKKRSYHYQRFLKGLNGFEKNDANRKSIQGAITEREKFIDQIKDMVEKGDTSVQVGNKTGHYLPMENLAKCLGEIDACREWLGEGKPEQTTETRKQPKAEKKQNPSGNKLVTDERYEQLKARMRKKLFGQLNMVVGIDPEILAIGTEMAVYHIEKGIRKFAPYAKAMIEDLGDAIRPYLKSFYNAVRDLPEVEENGWADELTSYDEVRKFDVANFDKEDADAMATADMIVKEQQAQVQAEEAKEQLTQTRNNTRHEEEEQRAADTAAIAEEADAVASEAESVTESGDEGAINEQVTNIDNTLEKVNRQLALLGYYEADESDPSKFHEQYGYMKTAEKKALADAEKLARAIAGSLGVDLGKKKVAKANIAPIGGDIYMRIPLTESKSVYVDIMLDKEYKSDYNSDNLEMTHFYFRIEDESASGNNRYLTDNNYFTNATSLVQVISDIERAVKRTVPEFVINAAPAEKIEAAVKEITKKPNNKQKSKKKDVSLQEEPSLFGDLFSDLTEEQSTTATTNEERNEKNDVQSRTEEEGRGGHQPQQNEEVGRSTGNEAGRPDGRGVAGRNSGNPVSDSGRSKRVPGISEESEAPVAEPKNTHNNHAERGKDYAPKGVDARIEANIKAIELMQKLMESGKPATDADKKVLRQFSGWGGLGKAFNENDGYNPIPKKLKELLGDEQYQAANDSRNSAYYTPASVIDTMWDIARALGFKGGRVLEGSAGIGNIIGAMPTALSQRSDIQAVEIDPTTGNILSLLYPDAKVDVQGFETTKIPNGSVDLAITNVPFVPGLRVNDRSGDKDLSKKFRDIHDFCIAKNIRKLREGGIGIFITTKGTLDSSQKLRDWVVNEGGADFIGAFRLNNETFGGTGATSDIIVVRKRVNGKKSAHAIDVSETTSERSVQYTDLSKNGKEVEKTLSMDYNKYFVEHPYRMGGVMYFGFEKKDTYRPTSRALYPVKDIDQAYKLADFANSFDGMQEESAEATSATPDEANAAVYEDLGEGVKEGSMVIDKNGNLCVAQYGKAVPLSLNKNKVKGKTKQECFRMYTAIKKALADVLDFQTQNEDDEQLKPLLKELNKAFDKFIDTFGHLHNNVSLSFLKNDVDYPNILALETYSESADKEGKKIQTYGKTDIFTHRVVETEKEPEPKTVRDGIIASIYQYGRIDVPYIAEKIGKSEEEVRSEIVESGLGFENPVTLQMEVSYEYLSGNVREKLRQAEEANEEGKYNANVKALQRVIPPNIPATLIDYTLGSSWIDKKLYEDYIKERTGIEVTLTNAGGTWLMKAPYYVNNEKNRSMGVTGEVVKKTVFGHELILAAMQNKPVTVSETHTVGWGSSKTTETITDKEATKACADKIDEIRYDFKDWARSKMQEDSEMSQHMEEVYNEQFNNYVPMTISDEFVPQYFAGANHKFKMRDHQARAIIRGTMQPILLAHTVGTGKTFTLISTAMEMRRLGTAKKPMIVVQNATVGQFVASAKELYPNAKVLTLNDKDHTAAGRKDFYAKIKYNDWDMIVVPQSVIERIPDSEERQMRYIQDKIEEKLITLEKMREADDDSNIVVRQTEKEIQKLQDELNELGGKVASKRKQKDAKKEAVTRQNAEVRAMEMLDRETDDVENFDDMGIDALLVDEAHEYKHLGFSTAMQRGVKGVDSSYSKKSQGIYLKTQAVLEKNNGRNVIFATGTPISNTAAEIWTFMRYLMPADTMKEYDIYYFDDFVRNFGNIAQQMEFGTAGYKQNNRFSGYVNLPELIRIWSMVADTVVLDNAKEVLEKVPQMKGGKAQDIYLPQTKALRRIMNFCKAELKRFDEMSGKEKKANSHIPLTMFGIAKAAAVDARLVQADAEDDPQSKSNEAVRQTLQSLKESARYNGTVAIFSDNYQNKHSGFNLYDDIRGKLIKEGVPAEQIVVMRSSMSDKKKLEIFDKVNRGEVRVILGSTSTLGTGVNIQERLYTVIHLDAPIRPMDYEQRNGRILRQGNIHKAMGIPVKVIRFGVEDSLDVTAYQRLLTKQKIVDSIMKGKGMLQNAMENRTIEEEEDVFGDTVAQLSGSQYAMMKNQAERDVRKYESKKKQWEADQIYVHNAIPRYNGQIEAAQTRAEENRKALATLAENFEEGKQPEIKVGKHTYKDMAAMADYFTDFNKRLKEDEESMRKLLSEEEKTRSVSLTMGDLVFVVKTTLTKEMSYNGGNGMTTAIRRKTTYTCPELGLEDVPVKGGYLKNAVEDILGNIITGVDFRERAERAEAEVERLKGELELVKARQGKSFEYADQLKEAHEHLEEYSELMKQEMEEKEKKYAEMDSSVGAVSADSIDNPDEEDSQTSDEDKGVRYRESDEEDKTSDELDEEYMEAVESGDLEKAQRMVDELAQQRLDDFNALQDDAAEVGFKYHRGKAPKKTRTMYAVFNVSPDGFRAAYAGNKNPTPVGVWLDAQGIQSYESQTVKFDDGTPARYIPGTTGKILSETGIDAAALPEDLRKSNVRWLLERGGKHGTDVPNFSQMNVSNPDTGEKKWGLPHNKLIFEIECGMDEAGDLTDFVKEHGRMMLHKNQGLAGIEPNQFYFFKTNPNANGNWGIAGTFRIKRLVPMSEVVEKTAEANEAIRKENETIAKRNEGKKKSEQEKLIKEIPLQQWVGGYKPEDCGLTVEAVDEMYKEGKKKKLLDAVTYDDEGRVIPLSQRFDMSRNDPRYRQTLEFEDGEILPITHTADGYSLLGLSGDYPTKDALLDAFREKYSNYLVTYTEGDKAVEVTPWHKLLSETRNRQSKKEDEAQSAYLARKTRNAKAAVTEQAKKLGLSVEVLDTTEGLTGRRAKAKGWYDSKTGKIVIVLPNHTNSSDVMRTLLHEGVAHHGLRELFGKDFDTFLDNVFANVSKDIRRDIVELSKKHGWNFRVATEEYLASMAEDTNFDRAMQQSWWRKVKFLFLEMLRKAGLHLTSALTDNDLRYILWRSYDNLVDPGVHSIFKTANAELVQQRLGVGNYAERNAEDNEEEVPRKVAEDDGFRYRDGSPMDERDRAIVRNRYEREMMSGLYQFREAVQDSMLSLRKLMEYICEAAGEKIKDFENAYMAENALSSKNHAEQNLYGKMLFQPLLDAVHALKKDGASRDETTRYMMAKHGLERNEVMAKRQAEKDADTELGKDLREAERAYKQDPSDQLLADALDAAKKAMQDKIDDLYQQYRDKDYGGITGLMGEDDLATAEAMAQQIVDNFERDHDTADLWKRVNTCTKATLDKIYKSGMLSKQGYDEISGMYKYYIPLRGFDATTSDEVYSYLTHESSGFSSPLKKAEGRRSIADDPLATIANMADSAIVQGNRNLMKQKFLKFVLNHPSDAASVNRMWLRYDDVTDQWEAVTAQLDEKDTPDDVLRKTEQFEEQMRQLAETDPDHYKRGKDAANIPYIALGRNLDEHQVHIRMGGDDYIVTINGNPRAAQALNGLTNPDNDATGTIGAILKAGEYINRQMSAFYTTRNPEFVLSNFLRDAMYANTTMWVREHPNYAIKFNKNFLKVSPGRMYRMLQKHNAGTLDMDDETEKAFYQFMMNGGETGYTVVKDIEKQKKLIKKYMKGKSAKIPVSVAWQLLGEKLDDINRSVENCARFAAFLTSRQMGRSVERSVYDAKEVSVNFNKKGAGSKFLNKTGQTALGNLGAFVSGHGRIGYVFWNASIQGTTNFARLHKYHTAKALAYDATLFMLGALIAGIGGGDDDDYWNLPVYVRRSNLCFKLPFTDSYVSIPLGIEMQGIYGMGELAASVLSGKERMSGMEIASAIAGQMSKMLPIDMMEGEGGLSAFIPSQIKPVTEAYITNRDWKGMPIYKDTPWNKEDPEWTKAGKTTNKWLVNFTEALNSVSGGDDVKKGWLDVNPSKIEHLLEGMFGGYTTTANKLTKMGETFFSDDQPFDWSNMLMASRVLKNADDEAEAKRYNREYWKYYNEYKETKRLVDHYEDQDDEGIMGAAEKLDFMYNSPEYGRYEIVDEYCDDIKDLSEELDEATDKQERQDLELELRTLKQTMVEAIREYDDRVRLVK